MHLTFPLQIGALVHHIMEHTAHHVDMSIPLYKLKEAQAKSGAPAAGPHRGPAVFLALVFRYRPRLQAV